MYGRKVVSHPYSSPNHNWTDGNKKSHIVVYHPYSSPNHNSPFCTGCYGKVVSHPYSSPNHNIRHTLISLCLLYLILIHHQTTTRCPHSLYSRCCISSLFITKPQQFTAVCQCPFCCISSLFITKPQHQRRYECRRSRCISSLFITKPQLDTLVPKARTVVSHPYSSPNHNMPPYDLSSK